MGNTPRMTAYADDMPKTDLGCSRLNNVLKAKSTVPFLLFSQEVTRKPQTGVWLTLAAGQRGYRLPVSAP